MIKLHSQVLTQSQLVVLLDILKEYGMLSIADNDINELVGLLDADKHCFKPIKSPISQLRQRAKPIKPLEDLTEEEVTCILASKKELDKTTKSHILIRNHINDILKLLKEIKGRD